MKGFTQLSAIIALASMAGAASAQNLLHNGDFENSSNHASLSSWIPLGLVSAKKSTFLDVTDAAFITFTGAVTQFVDLTAGQEYDLSGEAALFGLEGDRITVIDAPHIALSETNVTGHFSFDFTPTHTGDYAVGFGSLGIGVGEVSDLSLTTVTNVQSTPEPCSIAALGVGILGVFRARRKS